MAPEVLEVSRLLEAALSASGPEEAREAARAFGEEAQAQLTVRQQHQCSLSQGVRREHMTVGRQHQCTRTGRTSNHSLLS